MLFSPKAILFLRIVEYSTFPTLYYFVDNLPNVGLPEDRLEWDSNSVTKI